MSPKVHKIYIWSFVLITIAVLIALLYRGYGFYHTPLVHRFNHEDYALLKPSGLLGHGYGVVGASCILLGIFSYMARKRMRVFSRLGLLKHWLEFHIFLCTVGPILIIFHTTFKFGGIVAVCFWSMVAVVLSGILGRYIYLQIPHSIEGRMLSLREVEAVKEEFRQKILLDSGLDESVFANVQEQPRFAERALKKELAARGLDKRAIRKAVSYLKVERQLSMRIKRLEMMQRMFRYWHVAHLPFALIMLVVMVIHIVVALLFGYKWIF